MKVESAIIPTRDGTHLSAEINYSSSYGPTQGAIIFVHGFAANMYENGLFRSLADNAAGKGFQSVLYDWRGINDNTFHSTTLHQHVEDFEQVVQWTRERFPENTESLNAVGFSLGAAVVGLALEQQTLLSNVVYLSPGVRPRLSMWPRYKSLSDKIEKHGVVEKPESKILLGRPILNSLRDTDLGPRAFDVDIPLLVVHGTEDSRIDPSHTREIVAEKDSKPNFAYVEFDGASHSFRPAEAHWPVLGSTITKWLTD